MQTTKGRRLILQRIGRSVNKTAEFWGSTTKPGIITCPILRVSAIFLLTQGVFVDILDLVTCGRRLMIRFGAEIIHC